MDSSSEIPGGLEPGMAIGGCIIEALLGRGGMGVVYKARQYALDRTVAVKVIDPVVAADQEMRTRFMREARAAAAIEHQNVLPLYEIGQAAEHLYLVMRYVEGGDLEHMMVEPLDVSAASVITDQVAAALDAAHAAGLVHRDVKPKNILVDDASGSLQLYLTDFGLARRFGDVGLTLPGAVLGTPWYMAPEQALGQPVDFRADVYALGCVLFQLLTGEVPFPKTEVAAVLVAHQLTDVPSAVTARAGLPAAIDDVIRRALAKDPDERFRSAGDLAAAVRSALTGTELSTSESSVAVGEAAAIELFPEPTPDFIHSQCPRMSIERFDAFLAYLEERRWSRRDVRELVLPWAPRDWKRRAAAT